MTKENIQILSERDDIVVIADEAYRTQYNEAENMRIGLKCI